MHDALRSIAGVCEVALFRGERAAPDAAPDLLLEVAHGATRGADFFELRRELRGDYPADLHEFFFVNTDVGAPEVAAEVARQVVAVEPARTAAVVRCVVPRTLVDCNRRIERDAVAAASRAGEPTPGLMPWVEHAADRELLLARYFAYRDAVTAAFAAVCGSGGRALCVHTYAPRSVDVAVDRDVVRSLRAAYAPERFATWPLRSPVDLITHDPDGRELADAALAARATAQFVAAGFDVVRNGAYSLHPVTLAHTFAVRYPGQTLCLELRRDLLLPAFVPFVELFPEPALVARAAAPLARALRADA